MDIKRWIGNKPYTFTKDKQKTYIRRNKIKLKALLMRDVKTDDKGRAVLTKDDEWRKEKEWDKLYLEEKLKMTTQIAATPILYGEEAKKVIMEAKTTPSEKAKENGKKLMNYFEKFKS
ncbi:hypothetical protein [Clostridium sporogenes]|uniref:hypothetical protein n=1 Tax=Clostridium sporogenes TaxID=1509 RepID=UPI0013D30BDD|nr:hypothetical protein [Clostridium sporogenes]NFH40668.1 hypothetical protein [Clostridium sporogenes]